MSVRNSASAPWNFRGSCGLRPPSGALRGLPRAGLAKKGQHVFTALLPCDVLRHLPGVVPGLYVGAGLSAGGALLHQPVEKDPIGSAVSTIQDVTAELTKSHESLTQQAVDSIKAVQDAVGEVAQVGPLGSLAAQVIAAARSAI